MTAGRVVAAGAVAMTAALVGCGVFGDDLAFYGVYEEPPGTLNFELRACTAGDVTGDVTVTDDEIRVSDVDAIVQEGNDCSGVLTVDLAEPLGDRAVIVDGEPWIPFVGTCDRIWTLVPPDLPERFVDCPGG